MFNYQLLTISSDQQFSENVSNWFSSKGVKVSTTLHPRLALAAAAFSPQGPFREVGVCILDLDSSEYGLIASAIRLMDSYNIPVVAVGSDLATFHQQNSDCSHPVFALDKSVSMTQLEECIQSIFEDASNHLSK